RYYLRRRRIEIAFGLGQELRAAPGRAEIIGPARMLGLVLGRVGIDNHAADRVLDLVRVVLRDRPVIMRMTLGGMNVTLILVIVFGLAGHFHASPASYPKLALRLFCAFQPLEGQ